MSYLNDIRERGYCHIKNLFDSDIMEAAFVTVEYLYEKQVISGEEPYLNRGSKNLYNIQNKSWFLTQLLLNSTTIEDILKPLLNDIYYKGIPKGDPNYILRSFGARSSGESLPLHIDSFIPYIGYHPQAIQVAIMLEDSTEDNGCTLVVTGSHQSGSYASQKDLEDAIPLPAKAGDVLIWDSRLWHSAGSNTIEDSTRWAIIATFTRWYLKQAFLTTDALPTYIFEKLNNKQKTILGFHSMPYYDETKGVDMKRGYV